MIRPAGDGGRPVAPCGGAPETRTLYTAYAVVMNAVRSFAAERGVHEILPSPTAVRFEYAPERTYYLGPRERPSIVLPTSNTFQKQIAAANIGLVYCVAACYRKEPRTADETTNLHVFHQIEFELCGYALEEVRELALDLLTHVERRFAEAFGAHRTDGSAPRLIDLRAVPEPPTSDRFDDWSAALEPYAGFTVVLHTPQNTAPRVNKELPGTGLSRGIDILLPNGFGEALSGGERDLRQLRRYYAAEPDRVPSEELVMSGFGVGLERIVGWLLEERDLRRVRPPHFERRIGDEFHP